MLSISPLFTPVPRAFHFASFGFSSASLGFPSAARLLSSNCFPRTEGARVEPRVVSTGRAAVVLARDRPAGILRVEPDLDQRPEARNGPGPQPGEHVSAVVGIVGDRSSEASE